MDVEKLLIRPFLIGAFLAHFHSISWAGVNPATGEYSTASFDGVFTDQNVSLELRRFYLGLSGQSGVFGKKWCSPFDEALDIKQDQVTWRYCGAGRSRDFTLTQGAFKARSRGYSLSKTGRGFQLQGPTGEKRFFDLKGRLVGWSFPAKGSFQLERSKGRQWTLRGPSLHWTLSLNKDGLIEKVSGRGMAFRYAYVDGSLASFKDRSRETTYSYDRKGLLTEIKNGPHGQKISYWENGSAKTLWHRGCREEISLKKKPTSTHTLVELQCDGKVSKKEFVTELDPKTQAIRSQRQVTGGRERVIELHPVSALPARIRDASGVSEFSYDGMGRLVGSLKGSLRKKYQYDAEGFLTEYLEMNGPVASRIRYGYDKGGNLVSINNGFDHWSFRSASNGSLREIQLRGKKLVFERNGSVRLRESGRSPARNKPDKNDLRKKTAYFHLEALKALAPLEELRDFERGVY